MGPEQGRSWDPVSESSCLQFLHHWVVCFFFTMLGLVSNILSLILAAKVHSGVGFPQAFLCVFAMLALVSSPDL